MSQTQIKLKSNPNQTQTQIKIKTKIKNNNLFNNIIYNSLIEMPISKRGKFKMILVGDTAVGKTTLINSLNGVNPQNTCQTSTIGASFSSLRMDDYTIDTWDTAGQERYFSLVDMYFRNVDIAFFVYDINELDTMESIFKKWIPRYFECREKYNDSDRPSILFLIGNKADNPELQKKANQSEYLQSKQEYILENNIHHFIVSAWNQRNLNILVKELKEDLTVLGQKIEKETDEQAVQIHLQKMAKERQQMKPSCGGCV